MTEIDTPWGSEDTLLTTEMNMNGAYGAVAVKKIRLDADEMTSVHRHAQKNEIIIIDDGMVEINVDDDYLPLEAGEAHFIEAGQAHQIQNVGGDIAVITEVSMPYDRNDIERIEDPYADVR